MNVDHVTAVEDLTPEQVDEHMKDMTWGDIVENLIDELMENSDKLSMKRIYALNSMFVQTSYMGMLFSSLQADSLRLYEMALDLRDELAKHDLMSPALIEWDNTIETARQNLEENAE